MKHWEPSPEASAWSRLSEESLGVRNPIYGTGRHPQFLLAVAEAQHPCESAPQPLAGLNYLYQAGQEEALWLRLLEGA